MKSSINGFYVEFPQEFNLPVYLTQTVSLPKLIRNYPHTLGPDLIWSEITIGFIDVLPDRSTTNSLFALSKNQPKNFEVIVKKLHPDSIRNDKVSEEWRMKISDIIEIDFDANWDCENESNELKVLKLILQPSECELTLYDLTTKVEVKRLYFQNFVSKIKNWFRTNIYSLSDIHG